MNFFKFLRVGAASLGLALLVVGSLLSAAEGAVHSDSGSTNHLFDIRDYGANGDGIKLNTEPINRAIQACANAGGGQVLFPPGRYLSGTIRLRSHVALFLSAGATILGTTNLADYQQPEVPAFMPEAKWGKWHRGLILGQGVEDVTIAGPGVIDGNNVYDPRGEEHMRGPHAIIFVNCRGFTLRDFNLVDAANYAIYFEASDDVDVRNVTITGGWDGVHFRGAPSRWCHHVNIVNCRFYTGDDSIAGRYWDDVVISGCVVNSSCNGIRLIGPAKRLLVDHCVFYGPGERPHRTSARTNMLSGIILQPGAWDKTEGLLDEVLLANNTMRDVASPVTIWTKPGNPVGRITIASLTATRVYRAAVSVESWADAPITNVVIRAAQIEFAGGGTAAQANQPVKGPGVDARSLPCWGLYVRNVEKLTIQDVRLSLAQEDTRPVISAERVHSLDLDNLKFPRMPGVAEPIVLRQVDHVEGLAAKP